MKRNVKTTFSWQGFARLAPNHLLALPRILLVFTTLLLAAPVHAQIALQDGSTNIVFHASGGAASTNFTVTAGASVLVVELLNKSASAAGAEPASLSWGSQTIIQAVSEPDTSSTFRDCTIYYLYNPTPGANTISATVAGASVDLQVYTLSGVNTTVPPLVVATNIANGQVLWVTVPNIPAGSWAAVNALIDTAGTTGTITSPTSGTVNVAYDTAQVGPDAGLGYVSSLNPGIATFTATTPAATGKLVLVAAVFSPIQTGPATITHQPAAVAAFAGESATFVVGATGANLSFQWSAGSTPILGATNAVLTVTNLSLSQSGSMYSVVVTNSFAIAPSSPVTLTVNPPLLQHRYSFVSDASDSVGGPAWKGTLIAGSSPATINNGLSLPGTGTSGTPSGYVALPNGIVAGDTSVTVECWVTQNAPSTWGEIWSFGINGGTVNFGLIPSSGSANMRTAFTPNAGEVDINAPGLPTGTEEYVAVTYNNSTLTGNLYLNGVLEGTAIMPSTAYSPGSFGTNFFGGTTNDQIGRDPFSGDNMFNGTLYELRIWHGAVPQRYISASALLGPGTTINNDLTVQSATFGAVASSMIATETQPGAIYVTMTQTGSNPLLATSDATNWTSGNTNVLTVNSSGVISAVGPGATTVSATVAGITCTSSSITVTPQVLQHRYSFVSDASDSVGGAAWNGALVGPGTGTAATINNGLVLPGTTGGTQSGCVSLPSGIIQGDTSVTVDCWMTQAAQRPWAEVWDFGITGAAYNFSLIPFPANNNGNMEVGSFGTGLGDDYISSAAVFPSGVEEYVSVTYNDSTGVGTLYTNGVLDATFSYPIAPSVVYNSANSANSPYSPGTYGGVGGTVNNYIGADIYGDAQFDGTVYELRIWNGAVSPVYEALSSAAGSSVVITSTTASALAIAVPSSIMSQNGTQQAVLTGTFPQVTASFPGSLAVWTSGNPAILAVNSNGLITAVGTGHTTISATFQGLVATSSPITNTTTPPGFTAQPASTNLNSGDTAVLTVGAVGGGLGYQWFFDGSKINGATNSTLSLTNISSGSQGSYTVVVTNGLGTNTSNPAFLNETPTLMNEWSFNEPSGSTVAIDSIAGSNITLLGNTSLGGGVLTLPGGTQGDYAQFPNGIVSTESSITVETWFADTGGFTWAVPWCFASTTSDYIALIPTAGRQGGLWFAFNEGAEQDLVDLSPLQTNTEQYITLTYDAQLHTAIMYSNGVQVAISTAITNANGSSISPASLGFTTRSFLGLDQFNDHIFKGSIDEMRIWNLVVSPLYEAVSAAAGPNVVVTNVTLVPGSVTVTATTPIPGNSTQQATVTANFNQISGVPVTGFVSNWTSGSPAVLTVNSNGLITAVATGPGGTSLISATFAGTTASVSVTVPAAAPTITQQPAPFENLLAGGTLNASIANDGLEPYYYYWYFNNGPQPISGATLAALSLPNMQAANAGSYTCVVSNNYGSVTSTPMVLTITAPTPYQANLLALGPLAYWPLDETSGTVAYDMASGYNGTYVGNVTLGVPGVPLAGFGTSSYGAAFDGTTAYVDIPEGPFNITNGITAMAWVYVGAYPNFGDIFGHGDASWRLSVNGTGDPGAADGTAADATSATSIVDGNWHMVVYTYDGSLATSNGVLYVDGAIVAHDSVTTRPVGDKLDVWIGGAPDYGTARLLTATIAHAAVFTQALPAAAVSALYTGQPIMGIERAGNSVILTWSTGTLYHATSVTGPWTANTTAVSPLTVPAGSGNQFFRVQVP